LKIETARIVEKNAENNSTVLSPPLIRKIWRDTAPRGVKLKLGRIAGQVPHG
jgi:hypothetical protein